MAPLKQWILFFIVFNFYGTCVQAASEKQSASNTRQLDVDNATSPAINRASVNVTEIKDKTVHVKVKNIDTGVTNADSVAKNPTTETEEPIFRRWLGYDVSTTSRSLQDDIIPEEITETPSTTSSAPNRRNQQIVGNVFFRTRESWRQLDRRLTATYLPEKLPIRLHQFTHNRSSAQTRTPTYPYIYIKVTEGYWMPYLGASEGSSKRNVIFTRFLYVPVPSNYTVNPKIAVKNVAEHVINEAKGLIDKGVYVTEHYQGPTPEPQADLAYCSEYYNKMGAICGYYLSKEDLRFHFKNFNNTCLMEKENFRMENKRKGVSYMILNKGTCPERINDHIPKTWSSQDGIWKKWSVKNILNKANLYNDQYMEMMKNQPPEYDYKCKTYSQGYNSLLVHFTGACYWFSDHRNFSFEDARKHCQDIDGVSLTIDSNFERVAVAHLAERHFGRKLTWPDLFWSSYVQDLKNGKWSNKEDGTELNELLHKGYDPLSSFTIRVLNVTSRGRCGIYNGHEFTLFRLGVDCSLHAWPICKRVVPLD